MTSSTTSSHDILIAQRLADELGELERFIALLGVEQGVLQRGEADKLPPLIEQKSALAGRLSQLLTEREQALVKLGLATGREGMESWLSRQARESSLNDQWRRLLSMAETARNQQEINGKLIAVQLQNNQQALAALMSASGHPLTYGPDGQQRVGGGGRTLGSA